MKKHILLIDEDKNELKNLTNALNGITRFYKCTYASSARQGIEMLRFLEPDFIFVNYHLTGTDGLQLLSFIRNDLQQKDTRIFLYSEKANDEIRKKAYLLGASECVCKHGAIELLATIFKKMFIAGSLVC